MTLRKTLIVFLLLGGMTVTGYSSSRLLYIEAQGVASAVKGEHSVQYYSQLADDAMQKPSIGFDYVQKLSGEYGDWGALALQARLSYDQSGDHRVEPQLYNAYFKYKSPVTDVWLGHYRPAFGISSYLDNHGTLFQPLSMYGFGYDRDWGIGLYRDLSWGNAAATMTTGSGMPVYFKGNYLVSVRIARGALSQDNYTLGASISYGRTLTTMGYHLMMDEPMETGLAGLDFSWLWNNIDNRFEVIAGRQEGVARYAGFWRVGAGLMDEGRLKAELQPVYWRDGEGGHGQASVGLSYQANSSLTLRTQYVRQSRPEQNRIIVQVYWYYGL